MPPPRVTTCTGRRHIVAACRAACYYLVVACMWTRKWICIGPQTVEHGSGTRLSGDVSVFQWWQQFIHTVVQQYVCDEQRPQSVYKRPDLQRLLSNGSTKIQCDCSEQRYTRHTWPAYQPCTTDWRWRLFLCWTKSWCCGHCGIRKCSTRRSR